MFRKIDKTSTFNDVLKQIIENIQTENYNPATHFLLNVFWQKNSESPDQHYEKS